MPVGFEVYAETTGRLLIDSEASLMALVKKQTFTSMPAGDFTFTLTSPIAPLIAITCGDYVVRKPFISVSGTTWTYTFLVVTAGTTVTVYAFDFAKVLTPSNYGVQTFDPSGNMLYDAVAGKYMRPVSYTPVAAPSGSALPEIVLTAVPGGKTYAVCMSSDIDSFTMNPAIGFRDYVACKIAGGNAYGKGHRIFTGAGPPASWSTDGSWMVIDVTGF